MLCKHAGNHAACLLVHVFVHVSSSQRRVVCPCGRAEHAWKRSRVRVWDTKVKREAAAHHEVINFCLVGLVLMHTVRQRLRELHVPMCTRANMIAVLACVHANILSRHEIGSSSTTGGRVDRKKRPRIPPSIRLPDADRRERSFAAIGVIGPA